MVYDLYMKKFFTYPIFIILFLSIICLIGFGSLLRHHYIGGDSFQSLSKIAVTIAEVPMRFKDIIKYKTLNFNEIPVLTKHKDKKRFEKFIENKRNALLVLPRYDHSIKRSVVDVIDLNNVQIIHTYKHDIDAMNSQLSDTKELERVKLDNAPIRFQYRHPLLLEDGSLTSIYGPVFKIDFCSNLIWLNDEEFFHHSQMLDHEGNIWIGSMMNPLSQYVKKYSTKDFKDNSIIKINTEGKVLYNKSVTEILIENNLIDLNFFASRYWDPIHLNDIEPTFNDTKYWRKGDIFISMRHQSAIIHYRPATNKVINYIKGPFSQQHDVDIISDKEISIFNNNKFINNNQHSEVIIYNFESKKFRKLFNDQLQNENFKTESEGLSHIFKDGSLLVDESNHGRIILFNSSGEKEWEFINKDKNDDIGYISWVRIIEDKLDIEKFKSLVKNKKCLN